MTMKSKFIFFIIFATFIMMEVSLRAQEEETTEGKYIETTEVVETSEDGEETNGQRDILEKFTEEIPAVKQAYDECMNPPSGSGFPSNLGECIWQHPNLTQDIKDRITAALQETENNIIDEEGNEQTGLGLENNDLSTATQSTDSVTRALKNMLAENIKQQLFGDSGKLAVMHDHGEFNKIFASQLSKNTIEAIASYCLQVNHSTATRCIQNQNNLRKDILCPIYPSSGYRSTSDPTKTAANDKEALELVKIDNISNLKNAATSSAVKDQFKACAANIVNTCTYFTPNSTGQNNQKQAVHDACGVTRYLKNTKQALMEVEKIDKNWKDLNEGGRNENSGFKAGQILTADQLSKDQINIDNIVNVGSGQLDNDEVNDAQHARQAQAEECESNYDETKCSDFVITIEERDNMLSEYAIRKQAQLERLKTEIGDPNNPNSLNEEKIRAYLAEEGMKDEEIENFITVNTLENVAKEITVKYEKETENLIASLKAKLQEQTLEDPNDPSQVQAVFSRIKEQDRAQEMKEVIHYSNVVSSFLEVDCRTASGASCGSGGANTAALERELAESAFDPSRSPSSTSGTNPVYQDQTQFDGLGDLVDGSSGSNDGNSKTFDIETINRLIYGLEEETP